MKGIEWFYFNVLPENGSSNSDYTWGRVQINGNKIIFWHTASKVFAKAIEERKINGTIEKESHEDGKFSFQTSDMILTDSAINIVTLVETSDNPYFLWDDPMIFIKMAN